MMYYSYYVYAYVREDGTPYYIGKGKENRAFTNAGRTIYKPKNKSKIIFYQTGLTESDAFYFEITYIKLFGRKNIGTGVLRNLTDGGEGMSGHLQTKETKLKRSISLSGSNNASFGKPSHKKGKPLSEETKEKLRQINLGRKLSEKTKQKMSVNSSGSNNSMFGVSRFGSNNYSFGIKRQDLTEYNKSRKGKTFEEIHGTEKALLIKNKMKKSKQKHLEGLN